MKGVYGHRTAQAVSSLGSQVKAKKKKVLTTNVIKNIYIHYVSTSCQRMLGTQPHFSPSCHCFPSCVCVSVVLPCPDRIISLRCYDYLSFLNLICICWACCSLVSSGLRIKSRKLSSCRCSVTALFSLNLVTEQEKTAT